MKQGMLKKTLCIMMAMAVCLTSIPLKALADEVDDSACPAAADGNHVPDWDRKEVKEEVTCTEDGKYCLICKLCHQQYLQMIPATGHQEVKDQKVEATCTQTGLTEGSHCSVCGKVLKEQEEIPKTEHNWNKGEVVKEASCEKTGIKQYTCKECGETKVETIPATGHKAVTDQQTAATCTKAGLTEGSHCSVCGKVLKEQEEIPKTGHSWTVVPGVRETCTKEGLTLGIRCSVCGNVRQAQETIKATGHSYILVVTPPDKETGLVKSEERCVYCGEVRKDSTIEKLKVCNPEDTGCVFYGEDGKELKKISDKLQFYTGTSDDGAQNVFYADNSDNSQLRNFSAESEDGIHNLAVNVSETGTIQMNSPDGTEQMGIEMSLIDRQKSILFFKENHSIATITDIKQDGNSVILESENGNKLTLSSEDVKYEVGDIDDSDDSYIVAERVEGEENTVRLSTQSADSISEEQKETDTDEVVDTTEVFEPVQIVFGIVELPQEETTETNTGTIEPFTEDDEDETIEKFEEESPSNVIIKFVDPEEEKKKEEERKKEEEEEKKIRQISFCFEPLETACKNRNYGHCVFTKKKDDYTHTCKHRRCNNTDPHWYDNGKCCVCGFKHKNHEWQYYDNQYEECVVCHLKEPIEYKDYGDGFYCISKRTCHVELHSYQNGKCTRCGFEHVKHKYQYTSLDGKDKCLCGKEVSHKWVSNKNGKCVCQNCGHEEPHSYKKTIANTKTCRRCGAIDRDIKTTPTQPKKYYE